MTETNTTLTEAIAKCDEIKARLETLREMSKPEPVLRLESIICLGTYRELQSAGDLGACAPGTVIVGPHRRYFRTCDPANPWADKYGNRISNAFLWDTLIRAVDSGTTLKYLVAN